jgi:hypothetical protein
MEREVGRESIEAPSLEKRCTSIREAGHPESDDRGARSVGRPQSNEAECKQSRQVLLPDTIHFNDLL